ncbi:MAG: hypothetical protein J6T32_02685 [Paludibacteraceae bacterium]|nr:hypothetical protein [Paludibacteraceae bacterium]
MKKFFSIFAAALIVLGAASCKKSDKNDEPKDPAQLTATIDVSNIKTDGAFISVTPSDNEQKYGVMMVTRAEVNQFPTKKAYIQSELDMLKETGYTYDKLTKKEGFYSGKYTVERTDLAKETQYIVLVYQVDKNLEVKGDLLAFRTFITPSDKPRMTVDIDVYNIYWYSASITFSPSNSQEMYGVSISTRTNLNQFPSKEAYLRYGLTLLKELGYTYETLLNSGAFHCGPYTWEKYETFKETHYIVMAYQVDEDLNLIGDVLAVHTFCTPPRVDTY